MNIMNITCVPAIMIICYAIGATLKAWDKFDDRKIPVLMMLFGAVLGIVCLYIAPALIVAEEPVSAAAIGVASGALATCVNQAIKQAQKTFPFGYTDETVLELSDGEGEVKE